MSTANRHIRAQRWFNTVILRVFDIGVLNVRAIFKTLGKSFKMTDLKRLIAFGLAEICSDLTPEAEKKRTQNETLEISQKSAINTRLDNKLHFFDKGKRGKCIVHKSKRCETNKICTNCNVNLCNGEAWRRYHTLEKYEL